MTEEMLEKMLLKGVLLFFAVVIIYIPAMYGGYIYDDDQLLTQNPLIQQGSGFTDPESWAGLGKIWFPVEARGSADYFPATSTALWIEWRLFGNNEPRTPPADRGFGAPGYHIVNVLLHATCVLLLWLVLEKMRIPGAWIASFVWGVHPVCVESVAWISELKNTLSMALFLVMMLAWIKFQRTKRPGDYAMTIAMFVIALLAKTAIVMVPFVLLLYVWWERGWAIRLEIMQVLYFLATVVTFVCWCAGGYCLWQLWQYAGLACFIILLTPLCAAVMKLLHDQLTDTNLREGLYFMTVLLLFAVWSMSGVLLCWQWGWFAFFWFLALVTPLLWYGKVQMYKLLTFPDLRQSVPFFAIAFVFGVVTWWFQVTRAIGQEIVPIGGIVTRLAGACFALGFYVYKIVFPVDLVLIYPQWHEAKVMVPNWPELAWNLLLMLPGLPFLGVFIWAWYKRETWGRHVIFGLGFFVALLFPILGFVKMAYMRLTLVADHFQYTPMVSVIALCVAGALHFRQQLRTPVNYLMNVTGIAIICFFCIFTAERAWTFQDKERLWRDTLSKNEKSWQAHSHLGAILFMRGDFDGALENWKRSVELKPYLYEVHNNLGLALSAKGRLPEALEQYKMAVDIDSNQPAVVMNYADGLRLSRQYDEAVKQYIKVLKLSPSPPALLNLGVTFFAMGKTDDAINCFKQALQMAPGYPDAQRNLEVALQRKREETGQKSPSGSPSGTGNPAPKQSGSYTPPWNPLLNK